MVIHLDIAGGDVLGGDLDVIASSRPLPLPIFTDVFQRRSGVLHQCFVELFGEQLAQHHHAIVVEQQTRQSLEEPLGVQYQTAILLEKDLGEQLEAQVQGHLHGHLGGVVHIGAENLRAGADDFGVHIQIHNQTLPEAHVVEVFPNAFDETVPVLDVRHHTLEDARDHLNLIHRCPLATCFPQMPQPASGHTIRALVVSLDAHLVPWQSEFSDCQGTR